MSDPCEDICEALVAFLNALLEESPNPCEPFRFVASKPDDPNAELDKECADLRIMVWPHGSAEVKAGRGGECLETFQVTMLIIRDLKGNVRAELAGLARTIRTRLRGQRMAGYAYSGAEATGFDLQILHDQQRFADATILTYKGMG